MKVFEDGKVKDVLFSIKVSTIVIAIIAFIIGTVIIVNVKNAIFKSKDDAKEIASADVAAVEKEHFER